MALQCPLRSCFSTMVVLKRDEVHAPVRFLSFSGDCKNCRLTSTLSHPIHLRSNGRAIGDLEIYASRSTHDVEFDDGKEKKKVHQDFESDDDPYTMSNEERVEWRRKIRQTIHQDFESDDDPYTMSNEERVEWRRKIRQTIANSPDVEAEQDTEERKKKMKKLLANYPLVIEEEDPDWPEDAEGRGFNLDQFFDKITIKNVKKDNDEDYDSDKEIVWQDDNYIRPIKNITTKEWEDTVFTDFNPLVIVVHNRYKRPKENEKAQVELDKAIQMFWESGLPSPRCVAVDAVVEQDLVSALNVSTFPEVIFTKAGKILYRDKVVRTADEWSKTMAFFYYKAVRPPFLDKTAGLNQERLPSLS